MGLLCNTLQTLTLDAASSLFSFVFFSATKDEGATGFFFCGGEGTTKDGLRHVASSCSKNVVATGTVVDPLTFVANFEARGERVDSFAGVEPWCFFVA